jgi:hypothetical protein
MELIPLSLEFYMPLQGAIMINEPSNHGEGDPEAAERFNKAESEFVNSDRGKQKIQKGPEVRPEEEADLVKAEERAREHAKDDDSYCPPGRPAQR